MANQTHAVEISKNTNSNVNIKGTAMIKSKMMEQDFVKNCNTIEKFQAIREWLKDNGGARVICDALREEGFVEEDGDTLTLGTKPFNVFARIVSGLNPNPVDQSLLGRYSEEFVVCHNLPENDKYWNDESKAKTASMAGPDPIEDGGLPGHVFISSKDLCWDRFNVLVMGMEGNPRKNPVKEALFFLQRLEIAAQYYVSSRGWKLETTGIYLHCYPLNSVNSLHLHVVNLMRSGPALKNHAHKNLKLTDIITFMSTQ